MNSEISVRDRWLGAICYISFFVFISIMAKERDRFLARHCRQGFALLFAEIVGVAFIFIVDISLGQLPILGFILIIALRLIFFLAVLSISILGFIKALFGEEWRVPYLDELADRVPIEANTTS
ncbi:MAG: putative membrane protein [Candidatus Krumholzibacteriia bacterium]|jgi:uncharacterized membrane protein